jgi:hypothetical protein
LTHTRPVCRQTPATLSVDAHPACLSTDTISLSFGSAFHRTLEWVGLTRLEGRTPSPAETADLFQTIWTRQTQEDADLRYDEDTDADTCANQGREMAACLVNNIDPEERVISVSEPFAVPLVDANGVSLETPVIGEIDCTVSKAGITSLVDWKTSAKRWNKDKAAKDWQPTVFLYGYTLKHARTPGFRFDVVVKNKTPVFEQHVTTRCQDDFLRLVELAKLAESMIAAEHFAPSEQSFYCGGCPHQEACKAWHRNRARVSVRMAA